MERMQNHTNFFVLVAQSNYCDTVYTLALDKTRKAQDKPACWRMTSYRANGPQGHSYYTLQEAARELRYNRATIMTTDGIYAGHLLDLWTETPEWQRGLQYIDLIAAWQKLQDRKHGDLARELWSHPVPDAHALIPTLMAESNRIQPQTGANPMTTVHIGDTIYTRHEAENWQQYQCKMTVPED